MWYEGIRKAQAIFDIPNGRERQDAEGIPRDRSRLDGEPLRYQAACIRDFRCDKNETARKTALQQLIWKKLRIISLRCRKTAAPLKPRCRVHVGQQVDLSPLSKDSGPIEATVE